MKARIFFPTMIPLMLCLIACNHSRQDKGDVSDGPDGRILKFTNFSFIDKEGTGLEAFGFLMPSGWVFEGGMHWITDNTIMPAVTAFNAHNPDGEEGFEVFRNHSYFWTSNQLQLQIKPPGSSYYGSIVKSPVDALTALKTIVLPEHRSGFSDFQIIKAENLPELAEALTKGHYGEATGAKVRIAYTRDGIPFEEEIYAVVEKLTFPTQGVMGPGFNMFWFVDNIFSFKARQGELEENTGLFQTILYSFRVNPKWQAKYDHLIEYMAQQEIKRIHSIGEFSRMLSRMSDEMREDQLQQFEARNQVYDKVSENFSDYIRGVDKHYDPFEGKYVDLPSGYNHAWCNNLGEYVLTDNPNYNPNVGSNLTWKPMTPK